MAEKLDQFDEFKNMLDEQKIPYVELPMRVLLLKVDGKINIRLYHCRDSFCLSSWADVGDFEEKIHELLREG